MDQEELNEFYDGFRQIFGELAIAYSQLLFLHLVTLIIIIILGVKIIYDLNQIKKIIKK